MNEQLTLQGEAVATCLGCGLPRPEQYGQNERCDPCRFNSGEELGKCDSCDIDDNEVFESDLYEEMYFFSPWDDEESKTGFFYCRPCMEQGGMIDESKFYCDGCGREIAEDNGQMQYYRLLDDCELICLRCIEEDLKRDGVAGVSDDTLDAVIIRHELFGMFFNVGELKAEGWTADPLYHDYRVGSEHDKLKLCARAHGWHQGGHAFIIEYERLSIMGDEGYVTLWTKEVAA